MKVLKLTAEEKRNARNYLRDVEHEHFITYQDIKKCALEFREVLKQQNFPK